MNLAALGLTADELQALFDLILQRGATDARDGDWKWEVVATIAQLWLAVQNDRLHILFGARTPDSTCRMAYLQPILSGYGDVDALADPEKMFLHKSNPYRLSPRECLDR